MSYLKPKGETLKRQEINHDSQSCKPLTDGTEICEKKWTRETKGVWGRKRKLERKVTFTERMAAELGNSRWGF